MDNLTLLCYTDINQKNVNVILGDIYKREVFV